MGYQAAPDGSLGPPCGLYQFWSHTEGTALLLEYRWLLWPAFGFPSAPASPQPLSACSLSIDSIRDITGTEKINPKNQQH